MVAIVISKDTMVERIYQRYSRDAEREERPYLGASVLGGECARALWYAFRWAHEPEQHSPRMLRLFDTGLREEARVIEDLRASGVNVFGQQTEFRALGGHLRGHIDGVAGGLPEAPKTPHIVEIKTCNDKGFKDLLAKGVEKSKPVHYAQMVIYMHMLKYDRGIYIAINKNDESIYCERIGHAGVKKDAEALLDKARRIIETSVAPPKLHENPDTPSAYVCSWCPAKPQCHDRQMARRNCRTCVSSTAVLDESSSGRWHCEHWRKDLSLDEQRAGCPKHLFLPSLVAGEQVDVDVEERTVTYVMRDGGKQWVDGRG